MDKYLIIGLGNIGIEYDKTRHNIGFDILDNFAEKQKVGFKQLHLAFHANCIVRGRNVVLIKPTTYMNLSGTAFTYWKQKENIKIENCLVILDDLAIPLQQLKLKIKGGDGGHNGLKHIEACLQTQQYARLKFGIGNEFEKGRQTDFVLGKWQSNELELVQKKITYCADVIEKFCVIPIANLMNEVNANVF